MIRLQNTEKTAQEILTLMVNQDALKLYYRRADILPDGLSLEDYQTIFMIFLKWGMLVVPHDKNKVYIERVLHCEQSQTWVLNNTKLYQV